MKTKSCFYEKESKAAQSVSDAVAEDCGERARSILRSDGFLFICKFSLLLKEIHSLKLGYRVGVVVQQDKPLLGMPASQIRVPGFKSQLCIQSCFLLTRLLGSSS